MNTEIQLHRQIHPSFVVEDFVSNQAFMETKIVVSSGSFNPTEKDENKLSVYNGNKFTSEESYSHYTSNYISYGVLTFTVEEAESVTPLEIFEDNIPFDGHCYVDFANVESKNQKSKKAGKLRDFAVKRGWTYKP